MNLMLTQPRIEIAAQVVAVASFDPPVARPNEEAIYRVTFNALEESIAWPSEVAAPPELELRAGAHGHTLQFGGNVLQPRTSFNYRVRASKLGRFVIPEFNVQVYNQTVKVPAAQLEVVSSPPASIGPARKLILEIPATNLYAGQPVNARVLMPGGPGGAVQGLSQVQLTGEGFIVDQGSARQHIETIVRGGSQGPAYIYETTLTPLTAGRLSVFAQGFAVGNRFSGSIVISSPVVIQGGQPQYTLLDSDPVELTVKPLPRHGELPGFTGAIGHFATDPPILPTNVLSLGDPVKLTVIVRGDNPLVRLVPPPPVRVENWQVLAAAPDPTPPPASGPAASPLPVCGLFSYTLVPLTAEPRATPAIPFSYFDPDRRAYVDQTIAPIPVTIRVGSGEADTEAFSQADAAEKAAEQNEPSLSDLAPSPGAAFGSLVPLQRRAWFPLIQLAPAAAFLGLWLWDRRRRHLEAHPEILLRRRARRALRREWRALRQAAEAREASRFAFHAVEAMRAACAPHYPAEPRALVGADVLEVLPESERQGAQGAVVRRFFGCDDASRFAAGAAQTDDLLALQSDLDRLLAGLEARL